MERMAVAAAAEAASAQSGQEPDAVAARLGAADALPERVRAAQEVMDGIVGFHIHRGVLACGRRESPPTRNLGKS